MSAPVTAPTTTVISFIEWIHKEGPRGKVLISCGLLEQTLEDVLTNYLRDGKAKDDLFHSAGPLGTFSARIKLCFCLGMLDDREYHDLEVMRGIRNEFAHKIDTSFDMPSIKDRCGNLMLMPLGSKLDAVSTFVAVAAILVII